MRTSLLLSALLLVSLPAASQVRVTPAKAQGGTPSTQPWSRVPETFRNLSFPNWPLPTNLNQWQQQDRQKTRATLLQCLGGMPARPDPTKARIISTEQLDGYRLQRFEFHNGVDSIVPGILLIPDNLAAPAPAVILLHGHGSSKETCMTLPQQSQFAGPQLARKGFVVAAIDAYFNGQRVGKGPAGTSDPNARSQEESLFKLNLWMGRTLWGMMLRDEQCLIDYLQTRPEVHKDRIGASGMSMGCTRAWWLAAIDDRIQAIVGIACFTRYTELITQGNLRYHGIYYFIPEVFRHFDTEAIYALVAPRPMLQLSGDQDPGAPLEGVETLEGKLATVYALHGKPGHFRSVVYQKTGHEYLPEMKEEMEAWFLTHLSAKPK